MMYKSLFAGAFALTCFAAFGSSAAIAQEASPETSSTTTPETTAQARVSTSAEQLFAQRSPGSTPRRDNDPSLLDGGVEELDEEIDDEGNPVTFAVRLNTELFVNSGDLVEFLVPIRYSPSDRLAMEAVPVIKYFPESSEEEFDYGIKFAIEYQL